MTTLHPCAACARHVRTSEVACPFCGAAMPEPPPEIPAAPALVLSRGEVYALGQARLRGAAVAVALTGALIAAAALTGCGSSAYGLDGGLREAPDASTR